MSYTSYNAANGYEIENNSNVQSSSYCASQVRCHRGSIGMPSNTSAFTSEAYGDEGAETWQNSAGPGYQITAHLTSAFDHPFTNLDTHDYSPYDNNPPEEYRPMECSSNIYSGIGSQFQHVESRGSEENPFMDPVLSQDLLTSPYNFANVTVASQIAFEDHLQPLIPNYTPDRPMPSTASTATAYANLASYNGSSRNTGQAVMPIHATPWMAPTLNCSSTDPTTFSNYSSHAASVDTSHFNGSPNLRHTCYNAALGGAGTENSAHVPVALPGCTGNSSLMPGTEEFSNSNSTSHRPSHKASPSLAPKRTLKPKWPRVVDHSGCDKSLDVPASAKSLRRPPASVTKANSKNDVSKCPRKGCSATRTGASHIENMRTHVRDAHEKPAPPTCEFCGKVYIKNDSLRKHINASNYAVKVPKGTRIVRKKRADGRVYATYQVVHDYVNMRKMKKASL